MKFVYFRVADDDATAWPLSKLVDVRYNDATNLDLFFRIYFIAHILLGKRSVTWCILRT